MSKHKGDRVRLTLRLPLDTTTALQRLAEAQKLSLNEYMVQALDNHTLRNLMFASARD